VIGVCCCRSGLRDYEIKLNQRSAAILKLRQKQRICKTVPEQQQTLRDILAQNSAERARLLYLTGRALGENRLLLAAWVPWPWLVLAAWPAAARRPAPCRARSQLECLAWPRRWNLRNRWSPWSPWQRQR
jgi:hypothetical protein